MSKEFKKLLEQSYTKGFEECARTGHKVGDLDVIFNSIVMEEFAELIVRECANVANSGIDPAESHLIGNDILEHFGVEESLTKGETK